MNIYISSSWKNRNRVRALATSLRSLGHVVYDFTDPASRGAPEIPPEQFPVQFDPEAHVYADYLAATPHWRAAVEGNLEAIRRCDLCVLLLPCGADSHADWGVAVGARKRTVVVGHPKAGERTPSHLWAEQFFVDDAEVLAWIGKASYAPPGERYLSIDCETVGPIPGYQLLSFAAVLLDGDGREISHFAANVLDESRFRHHPKTLEWWESQPGALAATQVEAKPFEIVAAAFRKWWEPKRHGTQVLAYPASFDPAFMLWLLDAASSDILLVQALDVRSWIAGWTGRSYAETRDKGWLPEMRLERGHTALADAHDQGKKFCRMLAMRRSQALEAAVEADDATQSRQGDNAFERFQRGPFVEGE